MSLFPEEQVKLVETIKQGGPEGKLAFENMVAKYENQILHFFLRFGFSKEDAEDLVQETFIKVLRSLKDFRGDSTFQTWLYTLAKNLALNKIKSIQGKKISSVDDDEVNAIVTDDNSASLVQELQIDEKRKAVKTAIEELSPDYRMAIVLYEYEGLSYQEIAQTLKTSIPNIKSLIHRARAKLRDSLKDYAAD